MSLKEVKKSSAYQAHLLALNTNQIIRISSPIHTGKSVAFPAFITEYDDTYSVGWSPQSLWGRADPVQIYQGTTRSISLGFDVFSVDILTAKENFEQYTLLLQMLYPTYSTPIIAGGQQEGRTIKAPPILRLSYANFIKNVSPGHSELGLLGCISGLSFKPEADMGYFTAGPGEIYPVKFSVSFKFDPQHESFLGFDESGNFLTNKFPYGTHAPGFKPAGSPLSNQ